MKFTEKSIVEDYIIKQLQAKGWKFIPADELEREGFEEPLLIPNLIRAIQRINKELDVGDEEINKVLNELKLTVSGIEGAKRILNFYKFGIPIKFEKERVVKYIQLFDYEIDKIASPTPSLRSGLRLAMTGNNEFIVSRQVYYQGKDKIRTDIMLYVNGIPLVDIECKNPIEIGVSWYDAYKQIKDYEETVPELYKYVQIGVAAESKAKYFPIIPWQDTVNTYEWREELQDSIDSTIEMLTRDRFLDILKNFLFFRIEFGNAEKVVTRYMQYRAANKIVKRVRKNLNNEEEKNKGLVWHWQGSGKTLTMVFAAHKLYYAKELENPTIFFIVDRIELEDQLYSEFYSLDILKPEIIGSVQELKDVLDYDDYRGKRGIFITLIHKFRYEELNDLQKELEMISTKKETIMNRKNVIAFVDEGHRTQYGILAAQMKAMLKSSFFFALTGTPISKRGKDTYLEFSYPPDEPYLDRYFIVDSIKDGFTVKIVYQPRLEHLHLEKDKLETFLEVELDEIPEQIKDEVEKKTKERLNAIKVILENPKRIKVVAEDIAHHFKENVDGKFKAMVVAASRIACVRYKEEFDKHLPKEYSDVVMTSERDDKEIIYGYVREARERYGGEEYKSIIKKIIEKFKESEYPKILIVTDMLLTGFDAPVLQYMYLDKPLKEHRLLQAVARTNRPYKDLKEAGVVIDYVGILKEFKRALEMYSTEDIQYALLGYEHLRDEFATLIDEIQAIFSKLTRNYERETLLKAIEILTSDVKNEEEFVEKYRKLRKDFELLGPDEVRLEYFEIYKWISAIYTYYMKVVTQRPSLNAYVQKYYEKTVKYIHRTTEIEKLEKTLPTITFDEDYLEKLEERVKSRKEKAANILFT
ncbi:MAG: HsdR family type I site-specific deoxyribonuclease, partial [candidate division WOR-3 bacterium]|nr:HsdR family type I site-specific deoxyribonuclease [candidate division WOR-3 bacterium]